MTHRCDRRWEVEASREGRLSAKDVDSFERHLRVCAECRERKGRAERLDELAACLPDEPPSDLTLRRVRATILREVATGAGPRRSAKRARAILVAGAATIGLVAMAWAWTGVRGAALVAMQAPSVGGAPSLQPAAGQPEAAPASSFAGLVTPSTGARWSQEQEGGVERVVLDDGTISLHVPHRGPSERFLVTLPDGELEVRGTTFTVTVSAGATARVHVDDGLVELRLRGRAPMRIGGGQTWAAPEPPAATAAVKPEPPAPIPQPRSSSAASGWVASSAGSAQERSEAYATAVEALREGQADAAATAFQHFLVTYPGAPQSEDASFLQAVALARAGRTDAAALAAEQHLARFPASFHRKEAAILVARAACWRGDRAQAQSVLAPWPADPDVRAALDDCPDR